MYAIVVHGGAGTWTRQTETRLGEGVLRSAETGLECSLAPGRRLMPLWLR